MSLAAEGSGTEESEEEHIGVCAWGRGRGSSPVAQVGEGEDRQTDRDEGGGDEERQRWARDGGRERDEGRHSQGRDQNQEGDRDGKERQGTAEIETPADGGRWGVRAMGSSLEQEARLPSGHRPGTHTPHHHD